MSYTADLLGRPPVMRPIERAGEAAWRPIRSEVQNGLKVAHVPYATSNSSVRLCAPVHLPVAPWEVQQ